MLIDRSVLATNQTLDAKPFTPSDELEVDLLMELESLEASTRYNDHLYPGLNELVTEDDNAPLDEDGLGHHASGPEMPLLPLPMAPPPGELLASARHNSTNEPKPQLGRSGTKEWIRFVGFFEARAGSALPAPYGPRKGLFNRPSAAATRDAERAVVKGGIKTMKRLDNSANTAMTRLIMSLKKLGKAVGNERQANAYCEDLRTAITQGYIALFAAAGGISVSKQRTKANAHIYWVLRRTNELLGYNLRRAALLKALFEVWKPPLQQNPPTQNLDYPEAFLIRFSLAKAHFPDGETVERLFPAVDDKVQHNGFNLQNLLLFEHRKMVSNQLWKDNVGKPYKQWRYKARVDIGVVGGRVTINAFNYHFFQSLLSSIDVGASMYAEVHVSVRQQLPTTYFFGNPLNSKPSDRAATLHSHKVVRAGMLGNNESFYRTFKQVYEKYNSATSKESMADQLLVGFGGIRRKMLENACKYHTVLSSERDTDLNFANIEHSKKPVLQAYATFMETKESLVAIHKWHVKNGRKTRVAAYQAHWQGRRMANAISRMISWYANAGKALTHTQRREVNALKDWLKQQVVAGATFNSIINATRLKQLEWLEKPEKMPAWQWKKFANAKKAYWQEATKFNDRISRYRRHQKAEKDFSRAYKAARKALVDFLHAGQSFLDTFALTAQKRTLGYHSVAVHHYYKTASNHWITVQQTYSHMYSINLAHVGKSFPAKQRLKLGTSGTNGYSAAPHLHIRAKWSLGGPNTPKDDLKFIHLPPVLLLPPKK